MDKASLCPRLPVAAGVFSPGCCTSPRPSRRWTPAPRCARSTRRWIWCLWAGWQEAAWTPHSPSPGEGRGKREGVRTKHQTHSPLQHFSKKPNPHQFQHTWSVCCTGQNAAPSNTTRHFWMGMPFTAFNTFKGLNHTRHWSGFKIQEKTKPFFKISLLVCRV